MYIWQQGVISKMADKINIKLVVWRQSNKDDSGKMVEYEAKDISTHASFLEMMDIVNERLTEQGQDPIAFDHDCREGICGMCSMVVNGKAHGNEIDSHTGKGTGTTVCQLHMFNFKNGETVYVEPWRAQAFPVIKDLIVDRTSLDKIIQAGGYISVNTGGTPDANCLPISKIDADIAMDAAACIGCGACVASCKNASAMLFLSAKISHLAYLPQGQVERKQRVQKMLQAMDDLGFGNCTNQYECEMGCPKNISVSFIAKMNQEYICSQFA